MRRRKAPAFRSALHPGDESCGLSGSQSALPPLKWTPWSLVYVAQAWMTTQ